MRYELWNYRTGEFDDRYTWKIANARDYIPQDYTYQLSFLTRLMKGEDPRDAAYQGLLYHHDHELVDYYTASGDIKLMYQDIRWKRVAQNLSMIGMMKSDKRHNRGGRPMLSDDETIIPIYEELRFERKKIGGVMLDEGYFFHDPKVVVHDALVRIWDFVWRAEESIEYQEITYPEDWWQAFKERWFPDWLKEKYPVKYKKVVLDVWELYPTLQPVLPDHQPILQIMRRDY